MLTGHQGSCVVISERDTRLIDENISDVVPVPDDVADSWKHPPYSGYYDGQYTLSLHWLTLFTVGHPQELSSGVGEASTTNPRRYPHCISRRGTGLSLKADLINRTTVEMLLKHSFQPKRSVILAYGIDEESGGLQVSSWQRHGRVDVSFSPSFA